MESMKYELSTVDCISIKEVPENSRPRERLRNLGVDYLSDTELLCTIIGSGTKNYPVQRIAREILELSVKTNGQFSVADIEKIPGLGKAKACSLCASIEFGKRLYPVKRRKAASSNEVYNAIRHFGDMEQEHFICIMLNGALELLGIKVITIGLVNRALVHPREVFRQAIEMNATAIIIAHNHPSGNLEPSNEDIEVTERIKKAGGILGINLLDHIVFSSDGYLSLRETSEFLF